MSIFIRFLVLVWTTYKEFQIFKSKIIFKFLGITHIFYEFLTM